MVRIQKPKGQLWLPKFPTFLCGTKWYPCCSPMHCERCVFNPTPRPEQWIADLGAGGWIDAICSYCDQIAGQYTLDHEVANGQESSLFWLGSPVFLYDILCLWRYNAEGVCVIGGEGPDIIMDVDILLWHKYGGGTTWYWRAEVMFHESMYVWTPSNAAWAIYDSEETDEENCYYLGGEDSANKLTLTRTSNNHVGGVCTGSLPATIDLWVP